MLSTADFTAHHDRKLNGPKHFKTSTLVKGNPAKLLWRSYWRMHTDYAPGFNFKVTYHG